MITVRIKGGLGNQLFQYAAAYALSKRLNQSMAMDLTFFPEQSLRSFKLNKLHISETFVTDSLPFVFRVINNSKINHLLRIANIRSIKYNKGYYCNETRSRVNEWFFNIDAKDIYINGYFQSENYFSNVREDLLKQFVPSYELLGEFSAKLQEIEQVNSVAVHVRRGDFLKAQHNYNPHHYLLGAEYYHKALSYMKGKVANPQFFWFSDDIEWVKNTFGTHDNYHFVTMHTENPDIDEMMLMKNCKHIIAANSTFSWWAAWLNENSDVIVTVPDKRYGNESMIPERWHKIAVD